MENFWKSGTFLRLDVSRHQGQTHVLTCPFDSFLTSCLVDQTPETSSNRHVAVMPTLSPWITVHCVGPTPANIFLGHQIFNVMYGVCHVCHVGRSNKLLLILAALYLDL